MKNLLKREREGSKHFPLGAMPTGSWLAYIKLNIQFGHALLLLVDYISTNMSNAERCSMLQPGKSHCSSGSVLRVGKPLPPVTWDPARMMPGIHSHCMGGPFHLVTC